MKAKTLQIHWHAKQPVFSCDFAASPEAGTDGVERLATSGGDSCIRVGFVVVDEAHGVA
jgi:chromatin assembly factor 1 subunit B